MCDTIYIDDYINTIQKHFYDGFNVQITYKQLKRVVDEDVPTTVHSFKRYHEVNIYDYTEAVNLIRKLTLDVSIVDIEVKSLSVVFATKNDDTITYIGNGSNVLIVKLPKEETNEKI